MERYHSASRYQVVKIVAENGKDRPVNGSAFADVEKAISEAIWHFKKFGGLWLVADMRPRKRTDGFVETGIVVFSTLGGRQVA